MNNLFKEYEGVFDQKEETIKRPKSGPVYAYSPFALQDAVGMKDVKKIWLEYQRIVMQGIEPEEVIYKIIGKVKEMVTIGKGASIEDLGVKDFVYRKSKMHLKNWNEEDLVKFYTNLIKIYHESRMGGEELGVALEKLLLKV